MLPGVGAPPDRPQVADPAARRPAAWESLRRWLARDLADPQVFVLALLLAVGLLMVLLLGRTLAPLIAAAIALVAVDGTPAEAIAIAGVLALMTGALQNHIIFTAIGQRAALFFGTEI